MSKQPTPYQLKSQLAYASTTPAFLQRMKNQIAGRSGDHDDDDDGDFGYGDEPGSSNGARRATPPRRPDDDPGSADEDEDDEKPQVVVLKGGKHLTALEAENEKRKQKGLPPLADKGAVKKEDRQKAGTDEKAKHETKKSQNQSLSFSSAPASSKNATKKRKVAGDDEEDGKNDSQTSKKLKKKGKKGKALLSFGDGDEACM